MNPHLGERVDCHCGWARQNLLGPIAGTALLERHHQEVHGLGTDWFYRPAPWAVADSNPMPQLHLFRGTHT